MKLSRREIDEINRKRVAEVTAEHQKFEAALEKGECYLCGRSLTTFDVKEPCLHWLLRPPGFDKKHFKLIYERYDFVNTQSYLRWLANKEVPFKNINDLTAEKGPNKVFEITVKYKNFEWSFSCSKGDLKGHSGKKFGSTPHYHFQMKIDGRRFISYSDFHIPFSEQDLAMISVKKGEHEKIKWVELFDIGMQGVLDEAPPKELLDAMETAEQEDKAQFSLTTLIEADPGTTISGKDFTALLKESKRTGKPLAKLIREKLENVTAKTIISPGPSVPEVAKRKGGRRKKKQTRSS